MESPIKSEVGQAMAADNGGNLCTRWAVVYLSSPADQQRYGCR